MKTGTRCKRAGKIVVIAVIAAAIILLLLKQCEAETKAPDESMDDPGGAIKAALNYTKNTETVNCFANNETDAEKTVPPVIEYRTIHHEAEYKTIHHDAETVHHEAEYKTIHHDAVAEQVRIVDRPAWDEQVLKKEAWDEQVLVSEAYDEEVEIKETEIKLMCRCGLYFDSLAEWETHSFAFIDTDDDTAHSGYSVKEVETVTGSDIIHHGAVYDTVHHEAEYDTVHHPEKYHYEEKTTPAYDERLLVREAYDEILPAWDEQVLVKEAWDELVPADPE